MLFNTHTHTHTHTRAHTHLYTHIHTHAHTHTHTQSHTHTHTAQVLAPGLEERARLFRPLSPAGSPGGGSGRQLTPGYLDAPAAAYAHLGALRPGPRLRLLQPPFPPICIVFCGLEK